MVHHKRNHQGLTALPGCENRRRAERLFRILPTTLFGSDGSERTRVLDVSSSGLRILSASPIANDELTMIVELEPDLCVRFKGAAVWQQSLGPIGPVVAGVEFAADQPQSNAVLDEWLQRQGVAA